MIKYFILILTTKNQKKKGENNMDKKLLNKKQLAEELKISLPTAYRFAKEGMPGVAQGKKHLYDLDEVKEWLKDRNNASAINDLVIGQEYKNDEIAKTFKCSTQGGMRRSTSNNSLVLFTDHSSTDTFYKDYWAIEEDEHGNQYTVLHYSGMGLEGDQDMDKGQNPTLRDSNESSIRVFLFVTWVPTLHTFYGEVELFKEPYWTDEEDSTGNLRKVIKYPLVLKNDVHVEEKKLEVIESVEKQRVKTMNAKAIKHNALLASKANHSFAAQTESESKTPAYRVATTVFKRNPYIADLAKLLANGKCQLCEQDAPFKDEYGNPYLENHHIQWLSKGGLDVIENSVALCPNCHKKMHVLNLYTDVQKLKEIAESYDL